MGVRLSKVREKEIEGGLLMLHRSMHAVRKAKRTRSAFNNDTEKHGTALVDRGEEREETAKSGNKKRHGKGTRGDNRTEKQNKAVASRSVCSRLHLSGSAAFSTNSLT